MKILNLTQHKATPDQIKAGVVDLNKKDKKMLKALLTFDFDVTTKEIPTIAFIKYRAMEIAILAQKQGAKIAMIGGAPYLMHALHETLQKIGIAPVYAFSLRVSSEKMVDGVVRKIQEFKHLGFVE